MPDVSVVTPAAVVPADRLTLGATDARRANIQACYLMYCYIQPTCMA